MSQNKIPSSVSRTEQTYIIMPPHLNGAGRLFGGQLMSWIDMTAGIVGLRHCDSNIVTVAVDNLQFKDCARASDVVTLIGEVTYTGRTSLEVRVETFKENKGGVRSLINRAYLVMVAIDDDERPKEIPGLLIETPEQQAEWEAARHRRARRAEDR